MTELLDAISTKATSVPVSATYTGGYHLEEAPETTAFPYLVGKIIAAPTNQTYGSKGFYGAQIEISGFHNNTMKAAGTNFAVLTGAFDDTTLTVSGGSNFTVRRLHEPIPQLWGKDASGNDVWRWMATYEYAVA